MPMPSSRQRDGFIVMLVLGLFLTGAAVMRRIDSVESVASDAQDAAEQARSEAEEASSTADEAQSTADEALAAARDIRALQSYWP